MLVALAGGWDVSVGVGGETVAEAVETLGLGKADESEAPNTAFPGASLELLAALLFVLSVVLLSGLPNMPTVLALLGRPVVFNSPAAPTPEEAGTGVVVLFTSVLLTATVELLEGAAGTPSVSLSLLLLLELLLVECKLLAGALTMSLPGGQCCDKGCDADPPVG